MTFIIPSHIPIFAIVLPASADSPLSIFPSSPLPIIHATIPRIKGQKNQDNIPATNAIIEFVLALPDGPLPIVGGGGCVDDPGGGGGGGAPKSWLYKIFRFIVFSFFC